MQSSPTRTSLLVSPGPHSWGDLIHLISPMPLPCFVWNLPNTSCCLGDTGCGQIQDHSISSASSLLCARSPCALTVMTWFHGLPSTVHPLCSSPVPLGPSLAWLSYTGIAHGCWTSGLGVRAFYWEVFPWSPRPGWALCSMLSRTCILWRCLEWIIIIFWIIWFFFPLGFKSCEWSLVSVFTHCCPWSWSPAHSRFSYVFTEEVTRESSWRDGKLVCGGADTGAGPALSCMDVVLQLTKGLGCWGRRVMVCCVGRTWALPGEGGQDGESTMPPGDGQTRHTAKLLEAEKIPQFPVAGLVSAPPGGGLGRPPQIQWGCHSLTLGAWGSLMRDSCGDQGSVECSNGLVRGVWGIPTCVGGGEPLCAGGALQGTGGAEDWGPLSTIGSRRGQHRSKVGPAQHSGLDFPPRMDLSPDKDFEVETFFFPIKNKAIYEARVWKFMTRLF